MVNASVITNPAAYSIEEANQKAEQDA
jgi:hypothetical protein